MKKLILINFMACTAIVAVLFFTMTEKTDCNSQCCSSFKNAKPAKLRVPATDEQLFQFNRIYIKI